MLGRRIGAGLAAVFASRSIARSLAALGAAAVVTAPASVRAQAGPPLGPPVVFSPGLSFTANFGQKLTFGLGLDVRVTGIVPTSRCTNNNAGAGAYAQITWLNFSHWRFGAGAHGGGSVAAPLFALDGEVGWTYHTRYDAEHPGEHGLQLGVVPQIYPVLTAFDVPMRLVLPLGSPSIQPEGIIGGGIRFPATFGLLGFPCGTGRPLRIEGRPVLPAVLRGGSRPRRHGHLDGATRAALSGAWLEDARLECASVPTFLALARDLALAGAPAPLVARALEAAGDEVRHTLLCAELAADLEGELSLPVLIPPPPPSAGDVRDALLVMAREAWVDGCLGEGAAAARAAKAAASAEEPGCRAALAAIAQDEARHRDLGWSVLAYCLRAGGSEVGDAIAGALEGAAPEPPPGDGESDADPRALGAHGRITQAAADVAWADTFAHARWRAERLLGVARQGA